jgi:GNAT superfamily N-acetyltransferase
MPTLAVPPAHPPDPPPVAIRPALPADAPAVASLLAELGAAVTERVAAGRLAAVMKTPNSRVLLAVAGDAAVGLLAVNWVPMLHHERPVLRITALVVTAAVRGRGVGRLLTSHAEALGREQGCGGVELTTRLERAEAHAFYREVGYRENSLRFWKAL